MNSWLQHKCCNGIFRQLIFHNTLLTFPIDIIKWRTKSRLLWSLRTFRNYKPGHFNCIMFFNSTDTPDAKQCCISAPSFHPSHQDDLSPYFLEKFLQVLIVLPFHLPMHKKGRFPVGAFREFLE